MEDPQIPSPPTVPLRLRVAEATLSTLDSLSEELGLPHGRVLDFLFLALTQAEVRAHVLGVVAGEVTR